MCTRCMKFKKVACDSILLFTFTMFLLTLSIHFLVLKCITLSFFFLSPFAEPHTQMPPRMAEYKNLVQTEQGLQAFLPCLAHGNPPPKQMWYRLHAPNGAPASASSSSSSSSSSSASLSSGNGFKGKKATTVSPSERVTLLEGALVIHGARTQDSGKYVCVVNNTAGEDRAETDLLVTGEISDCSSK